MGPLPTGVAAQASWSHAFHVPEGGVLANTGEGGLRADASRDSDSVIEIPERRRYSMLSRRPGAESAMHFAWRNAGYKRGSYQAAT